MKAKQETTLKFTKVRNVKSPCRAHPTDAGIDFFIPEDLTKETIDEKTELTRSSVMLNIDNGFVKSMILEPKQSVLIPSGIKVKVPDGYMLQFNNKSGVASKKGLIVGASVVDVGYEGECHIDVHNVSSRSQVINAGDKIVQAILIPVSFAMPEEVASVEELYAGSKSERGEGGFGSSGTN